MSSSSEPANAGGQARVLNIPGTLNFRDLGGYVGHDGRQVRWGRAFRCAQLDRLQPEGIRALQDLQVKTVIDLRFEDETHLYPTMRAAFPKAQFFSWQDEVQHDSADAQRIKRSWRDSLASNDPEQVREAMRENYPTKLYSHKDVYRRMLQCLMAQETPLVFHCAAGKDRTGVAAALILSLLGVDETQVMEDYLLTHDQITGRMEAWLAGGATDSDRYQEFQQQLSEYSSELVAPVFETNPAYMQTLLDYVRNTYGSFTRYAKQQLGFSNQDLSTLQDQLLE